MSWCSCNSCEHIGQTLSMTSDPINFCRCSCPKWCEEGYILAKRTTLNVFQGELTELKSWHTLIAGKLQDGHMTRPSRMMWCPDAMQNGMEFLHPVQMSSVSSNGKSQNGHGVSSPIYSSSSFRVPFIPLPPSPADLRMSVSILRRILGSICSRYSLLMSCVAKSNALFRKPARWHSITVEVKIATVSEGMIKNICHWRVKVIDKLHTHALGICWDFWTRGWASERIFGGLLPSSIPSCGEQARWSIKLVSWKKKWESKYISVMSSPLPKDNCESNTGCCTSHLELWWNFSSIPGTFQRGGRARCDNCRDFALHVRWSPPFSLPLSTSIINQSIWLGKDSFWQRTQKEWDDSYL